MMKGIKEFLKSRNAAYFFFCYYLHQLFFCIWIIFVYIKVGVDKGGTVLACMMILVSLVGLSSSVKYFSKQRIGFYELQALIFAPLFVIGYISVIIRVFIQTGTIVYAEFIERGIV